MAATFIFAAFVFLIALGLTIIGVMAVWKLYAKAGKPGWASLIPIYNTYVLLQIVHRPTWWIVFYCIPILIAIFLKSNLFGNQVVFLLVIVSLIFSLIVTILHFIISINLAKCFGKSTAFGIFLLGFFTGIGYLILGLGKSTYVGATPTPTTPQPAPSIPQALTPQT